MISVMSSNFKARPVFHEATRKRLVRAVVLCVGIFPMVLMGLATIVYWSPYYQLRLKKDWESRVSANLGVRVEAASFQLLAPEQFLASDVVLYHPETDAAMARVRQVAGLIQSRGWSLVVEDPQVDAKQLETTLALLHDGFLCKPQTRERMLSISVPRGMEIHHDQGVTALGQVEILMKPTESRSSIVSRFVYVDQPFGEIQVQVVRDHTPSNLSTRIEVRSEKSWIACSNFSDRFATLNSFGKGAQFRGVVKAQWGPQGWDAIVQGELDRVELGDLSSAVGAPLRGVGGIQLDQLNMRDGQILFAQGRLECGQGSVQTDWIRKASQWLQLPSKWDSELAESQSIEAFSCAFELSPEGLRLHGQLPGPSQWPPVAMKLGQATLCTPKQLVPLTSLVAALQAVPGFEEPGRAAVDLNAMYLASILPWPQAAAEVGSGRPQDRLSRLSEVPRGADGSIR